MTNRDRQAEAVSDLLLELLFPNPRAGGIAAPAISFDQQLSGLRKAFQSFGRTPLGNIVHRKGGRVGELAHVDGALIVLHIVDAVRHGLAQRILRKVMHVDALWPQVRPAFLKSPISSFFLVSTLITG